MKNKKGIVPMLITTSMLIVVAVLILFLVGGTFAFISLNPFLIGGLTLIVLTLIFGLRGNPNKNKTILMISFVLVGFALIFSAGVLQTEFPNEDFQGNKLQYAVPIIDSIRCEVTEDILGIEEQIPQNGFLLSKETIGFNTNKATNIRFYVSNSVWNSYFRSYFGGGTRIYFKICDTSSGECAEDTKNINLPKTYSSSDIGSNFPNSLDLTKENFLIKVQARNTILSQWKDIDSRARIQYDSQQFGLVSYTESGGIDQTFCVNSCSLSCLTPGVRQKIYETPKDTLDFRESVNYIARWDEFKPSINEVLGGTVYIENENKFCFGKKLYEGGEIETDDGTTWVYPDRSLPSQNIECCPGARISSDNAEKVCQDDYTWKTIASEDVLTCNSDIQCFNAEDVCRNKKLSSWGCTGKDNILGNICEQSKEVSVGCCSNSDCDRDQICDVTNTYTCVGGNVNPPIEPENFTDEKVSIFGSLGNNGSIVKKDSGILGYCQDKANSQPLLGWTYSSDETITEPSAFKKIITFGLANTNTDTKETCTPKALPYYLLGLILILGTITAIVLSKNKPKKRKKKK